MRTAGLELRDRPPEGCRGDRAAGFRASGAAGDCGRRRNGRTGERRCRCAGGRGHWGATRGRIGAGAPVVPIPSIASGRFRVAAAPVAGTARPSTAPVLGGEVNREALAPFLAAAGQRRATPPGLHACAKPMLIDPSPVARTVRRLTHSVLSSGGETYTSVGGASRLTFPHGARSFAPPLLDVPPKFIAFDGAVSERRLEAPVG